MLWDQLYEAITGQSTVRGQRARRDAFLHRFSGRTLIVHTGLSTEWLEELFKTGGGAGHFRLDARPLPQRRPTPVEWVVQEFLLPLGLPLPVLVQVAPDCLRLRHLQRYGAICHPADILWIVEDMRERERVHATLYCTETGFRCERGIHPDDNEVQTPDGLSF